MIVLTQFEKSLSLFKDPVSVISARDPHLLADCFNKMEEALRSGYYLAGFLSYEAGYAFEERLFREKSYDFPLLCMGVYAAPQHLLPQGFFTGKEAALKNIRLNVSKEHYFSDIASIREYIACGDVYQITYCIKLLFDFEGDPRSLYQLLLQEQPVPYPAYIEAEGWSILSLSPEKFLKKKNNFIVTKPMKGTWLRGQTPVSDFLERVRFGFDRKNRAENVMIADLLRNDLGRVARVIRAPRLFEVTGYRKLYQMTSTVTGRIARGVNLYSLLAALFPSGSVTGAPRMRAMEVIGELEGEERRIYTGAIGYITPEKDLFFNIPIRTLLLRQGGGEMGIGGGIVWDSTPEGEWQEGLLKARFVTDIFGDAAVPDVS